MTNNPTINQALVAVRAAQGREVQAGLYPNPLVGYALDELTAREPGRNKNFFWFQVPIVTAGKLGRSRDLAATDRRLADTNAEMQGVRVLTTVRLLFYEALGAARLVELRREQLGLVREAASVSEDLFNVGQADRPDVLAVEIEVQRAEIELAKALTHQTRTWRVLAAVVGNPALPVTPLAGDLEANIPSLQVEEVTSRLLRESPEIRAAQVNVERARAALERVKAERIPNLFVRTRVGYNSQSFAPGKDVGFEAGVEIGVPLPLFDRQQGNLATAEADLEHARREVQRLELALRSQVASAIKSYEDSRAEAERYQREILPRAQQAYELYLKGFRQMAAAYPQVLIAQRTLFQARTEYVQAVVDLWRGAVVLEGMLLSGGLEAPFHRTMQLPSPTGHVPAAAGRATE